MNQESKKRIIVVLGMHRSGTSAITRGIKALGIDLGDKLMPAVADNNERGFWEDTEVAALNDVMLQSLGFNWHSQIPVERLNLLQHDLASFKLRAVELLRSKLENVTTFGLKDPRLARLLPFWKTIFEHLGVEASYVVAIRHPLSVAASLNKRDDFEIEKSNYLWLGHVVAGMLGSEASRRVVVDYDLLMERPKEQLSRMAAALGLPFDESSPGIAEYIDEFLTHALRHTRFYLNDLSLAAGMPQSVTDAYILLDKLAKDKLSVSSEEVHEGFLRISQHLYEMAPAFSYMTRCDEKIVGLSQINAQRDQEIAALNQTIALREEQAAGLTSALEERDAQIIHLSQAIAEHERQISSLIQVNTQGDHEIAALVQTIAQRDEQAVAERDAQIIHLSQAIAEHERQISSLIQVNTQGDHEIAALVQTIAQRDEQAVAERDAQIIHLRQAIGEHEGHISSLIQGISERDEQISCLNRGIAQRDEHATDLTQAMAKRDALVVHLHEAVAESEEQSRRLTYEGSQRLADKDQELTNLRLELADILHSRSWCLTGPLRRIAALGWRALSLGKKLSERFPTRRKLALWSAIRQIRSSSLFDPDYYVVTYPDVHDAKMDPASHFAIYGWKENRNPSAAFDTEKYLADNPDVATAGINPLVHYLSHGRKEGRPVQSPASAVEDSADAVVGFPLQSLPTNDVPDEAHFSQAQEFTVETAIIDTEVEDIRKSGLFSEAFYLSMYPDLQPAPADPIRHYCERGWREGLNPSDDFDTRFYLATYSDIRNANLNPFWHYVVAGAAELRHALPDLSPRYEDDIWFGTIKTDIKLLAFYTSPDWPLVREARPLFKGHWQPKPPDEGLGCYDPLDWRALNLQAQMAKRHGVHGFCFDLDIAQAGVIGPQPIERFLAHDEIDIPFCVQISIAPENVVKLVAQSLARVFLDRRQIRVEDRPVLLVKVKGQRQHASAFLVRLRQLLADKDGKAPFVIGRWMEEASDSDDRALLADVCDASLDLSAFPTSGEVGRFPPVSKNGIDTVPYNVVASSGVARTVKEHSFDCPPYHAITLGYDNTARASARPLVYTRFHIRDYRRWLDTAIASTRVVHRDDRRFVFVNAWNNWNEGLYLEPDRKSGFSCLNETSRALLKLQTGLRMPKVSVIVPNYNHEAFLRRRLDSIYGQTYKNIEVLLLDDCSSDRSRSVLDDSAAANPEVTRTIYNDTNSGSAFRQWAKGIKEAAGELIWIAESDDFCDECFLEALVRCFDDEAVLLAYGNTVFVDREEMPLGSNSDLEAYVRDLNCGDKWTRPYVTTAHNEVATALGIKNTIPNASGALFKRPIDMPLLEDESWLSMRVAGDWVFYLHVIRGGKIAYRPEAINFFRRYQGSTAETAYKTKAFYREIACASRTVASLYDVPLKTLERCRDACEATYFWHIPTGSKVAFARWYGYEAVLEARDSRSPNIMISTMGFYPGGAEILPIRMANEFKRQGHSVLLLSAGLNPREDGVRRMLRNDVALVETPDVEDVREIIRDFGIEALNTHQWHIQKYPLKVPDVFDGLRTHVASMHGMIEYGDAFQVTEDQLRKADQKVTTWVYTAKKNLEPFSRLGLFDKSSGRFIKLPNGMQSPDIAAIPRAQMDMPEDAFVLCCVSRAIPDKGWPEMIAAVELARTSSGRDIRLILVGSGPVYDEYCQTGTPDFVYLAGFSENSVGHYAAADMGIMLTKFKSESFPLTVVDCLFAGKPFIASDVGDIRNMLTIEDKVAGSVIELDNWEVPIEKAAQDIAAFASDREKCANASALVKGLANRYRIDVVASQYLNLFRAGRDNLRLGERASIADRLGPVASAS